MLEYIVMGAKYGLLAATTVGVFAVCVTLLTPVVLLAINATTAVLNIGGKKNG